MLAAIADHRIRAVDARTCDASVLYPQPEVYVADLSDED